jgi:hypothetical protein
MTMNPLLVVLVGGGVLVARRIAVVAGAFVGALADLLRSIFKR